MAETELHTVSARGFSATVDAYAVKNSALWFISMVGPQTAVKAISAAFLKQPPDPVVINEGVEGGPVSSKTHVVQAPWESIGTWTTKIAKLPLTDSYHMICYTKMAEYHNEKESFVLIVPDEGQAPQLHQKFLDRRLPLPLHDTWAEWLWQRGLHKKEIEHLTGTGIVGFLCRPAKDSLRRDITRDVRGGILTVPPNEGDGT